MRKKGKVLDMAAKTEVTTVKIRKEIFDEIEPTLYQATGLKVKMQDFVSDAVAEKLAPYKELAKKRAAESKHRKREAS